MLDQDSDGVAEEWDCRDVACRHPLRLGRGPSLQLNKYQVVFQDPKRFPISIRSEPARVEYLRIRSLAGDIQPSSPYRDPSRRQTSAGRKIDAR